MKTIDHTNTQNITCPYCGWEDQDSWEVNYKDMECGSCDKKFTFEKDITVTYSTYKLESDCEHVGTIYCDDCGKSLPDNPNPL